MWLAGMTFGYGFGFLLIISAITIGVSLPYFIGSLFYHKIQVSTCSNFISYLLNVHHSFYPYPLILKLCFPFSQGWLEKYPKRASVLRLAGEGDCVHQFRAVALIRISPFPYILYNYCAVATNVRFGPYILGSLVGMVPEIFVTIYTYVYRTLPTSNVTHTFTW